jgi:hypothetical protein
MLGDVLGETHGKVNVRRVVQCEGPEVTVEVSFSSKGTMLGVEVMEFATYTSVVSADGTMLGEGQGVLRGKNGEMISWKGQGAGRFTPNGGVSYRGAIYYRTASPGLARLNGVAGVFEYDADANDNTHAKVWEWK